MPKEHVDAELVGDRDCCYRKESDMSNPRFESQAASLPVGLCPRMFAQFSTTQPAARTNGLLDVVCGDDPEVFRPERWLMIAE